jgi:uncharacterized protein (TIGR00730 family)
MGLVYGGGGTGLMGAVANGCLEAGGQVIGVIPHALRTKELAHAGVTEMIVVDSMHERKARMADLADAFVALPGGLGTLEEICEIATWLQLGIHRKPCGFLNVGGYLRFARGVSRSRSRGAVPEARVSRAADRGA